MLILNFLLALAMPYFSVLNKLIPPDTIPVYFNSPEAAFVAGEFFSIIFFWAGFLRNAVAAGELGEQRYFLESFIVLIFICASKIIFAMPYAWIIAMFSFGLGVLSAPAGQTLGSGSLLFVRIISVLVFSYSTFVLIGMAWFEFTASDYYLFKLYMHDFFSRIPANIKLLFNPSP